MTLRWTRNGLWIALVVTAVACGEKNDGSDGDANGGTGGDASMPSSSSTGEATPAFDCETDPAVLVWLQNEDGGFVYADVTYSIDGGPRRPAEDCSQGACFIYEGYDQPIEVFARYADCTSEDTLSIRGAACGDDAAAELLFAFYDACGPDTDTDGGSGGGGSTG